MKRKLFNKVKRALAFTLALTMFLEIPLSNVHAEEIDTDPKEVTTTSVSGSISWVGDAEETRPESVTVKLMQNEAEVDSVDVIAENDWVFSFNDLAVTDGEGAEYTYSVQGDEIEGYELSHDGYNISYTSSKEISDDDILDKGVEDDIAIIDDSGDAIGTDNWEIDLVFYDSTVNNGKTPLTAIDWDASDGGCGDAETRVITVQINYKNTNVATTYEVGELNFKIPNLIYGNDFTNNVTIYDTLYGCGEAQWKTSAVVGANDSTHEGYDWSFISESEPTNQQEYYIFENANKIEAETNFEGSVQIVYTITPSAERGNGTDDFHDLVEKFDEQCTHNFSKNLQVALYQTNSSVGQLALSSTILLDYTRTYMHPWKRQDPPFAKSAEKVDSYDGLSGNVEDYIWVKYVFEVGYVFGTYYSRVGLKNHTTTHPDAYNAQIHDSFPEGCMVHASDGTKLEPLSGNEYVINWSQDADVDQSNKCWIYVGYPKSLYNKEADNLKVTNTADLYFYWDDGIDFEYYKTASVSINLADFEFNYEGNLYGVTKSLFGSYTSSSNSKMRYQDILLDGTYNKTGWSSYVTARYTGSPMTVKFGDDLLYSLNSSNEYVKLEDDEYYFSYIEFPVLENANGITIADDKYDCEFWVRYAGDTDYTLYEEFKTTDTYKFYNFKNTDEVVGYYCIIKDMQESIYDVEFEKNIRFTKQDIPQSVSTGGLWNFNYLQVFFRDENGNLILQNEPEIDSYANFITKDEIASFDLNTYGTYMQRSCANALWYNYNVALGTDLYAYKNFNTTVTQDVANEEFRGKFSLGSRLIPMHVYDPTYQAFYSEDDMVYGFVVYDLLPKGMEVISTPDSILQSMKLFDGSGGISRNTRFYDKDLNRISSASTIKDIIKDSATISIVENWNNTGRTWVKIEADFSDNPFYITGYSKTYTNNSNNALAYVWDIEYKVSYDSYLSSGGVFDNYCYADFTNQPKGTDKDLWGQVVDNGKYDSDTADIDRDSITTDKISYYKGRVTINSVVSTHQDVQVTVQTDKSNYSTGTVLTTPETGYSYKLRARSGSNDVTNLVLINNLEEAYGSNSYWKGEFLGIDDSFAESKGYSVKVYYSENTNEDELYLTEETTSTDGNAVTQIVHVKDSNGDFVKNANWKEYSDTVDKSKVKSLAFEFLNAETGEPAILPANNLVYVEVLMKAPKESEGIDGATIKYAYNNCFTQWNAIDEFDQIVDFITGIHSNTVKVNLVDKMTIAGAKSWVGDRETDRPESITVNLLQNGTVYKTLTTTADDNWEYAFNDVPIINEIDDSVYTYSIEEEAVEGYTTSYASGTNGLEIIIDASYSDAEDCFYAYYVLDGKLYVLDFSHIHETSEGGMIFEIPSKEFYLAYGEFSCDPSYITSIVNKNVSIPKEGHIQGEFKNVDELCENAEFIWEMGTMDEDYYGSSVQTMSADYYDVIHGVMASQSTSSSTPTEGLYDIVNTAVEKTTISGTKTWVGDTESDRPESITVKLLRNGEIYKSKVVTADDDWKYSFTEPVCDEDGNEYEYTVEEEVVSGYATAYTDGTNGVEVTLSVNPTDLMEFGVSYALNGIYYDVNDPFALVEGQSIYIPSKEFHIFFNEYDGFGYNAERITIESIIGVNVDVNSDNVTELSYNDFNAAIYNINGNCYSNEEFETFKKSDATLEGKETVDYLITVIPQTLDTPTEGFYDIVNTKIETTTISGTKTWVGDEESDRPESITVNLMQNGTKIDSKQVTATDDWKYSFEDVLKYDDDGNEYVYTVEEEAVDGYVTSYSKDINGIRLTHTVGEDSFPGVICYKNDEGKFICIDSMYIDELSDYINYGVDADGNYFVDIPSKEFYIGPTSFRSISTSLSSSNIISAVGIEVDDTSITEAIKNNVDFIYETDDPEIVVLGGNAKDGSFVLECDGDYHIDSPNGGSVTYASEHNTAKHFFTYPIKVVITSETSGAGSYDIINTKIETSFPLEFTKVDFLTGNAMADVVFSLYKLTCENTDASHNHGKAGSTNCWTKVSSVESDENGKVVFEELVNSKEYGLVEVVPDGYILPNSLYWKVIVNDEGTTFESIYDESEMVDWNKQYGWTGYSFDIQEKNGVYSLENMKSLREVKAIKRIKTSDINFANGNPTFLFKLSGTDERGIEYTYYKSVEFEEDYVESTGTDGYVSLAVDFKDIVAGNYTLSEDTVSRYDFEGISDVINGTVNDETVQFDLVNNLYGQATYTNKVYESQWFGHNDIVVNNVGD